MAALAADVNCRAVGKTTTVQLSANAADTFYRGGIAFIDTGGGVQATWAAGDRVAGVIPYQQTTTASGENVVVMVEGLVWLPVGSNIGAADEGDILIINANGTTTDNPADTESATDATAVAGDALVGRILRVTSTEMLIHISPALTGGLGADIGGA